MITEVYKQLNDKQSDLSFTYACVQKRNKIKYRFYCVVVYTNANLVFKHHFSKTKTKTLCGEASHTFFIKAVDKVDARNQVDVLTSEIIEEITGRFTYWNANKYKQVYSNLKNWNSVISCLYFSAGNSKGSFLARTRYPFTSKITGVEIKCVDELTHAETSKHFTTKDIFEYEGL